MLAGMWVLPGLGGVLVVISGALPGSDARYVALTRGGPIMGFLVAITVLAELADRAGVFDAAAGACARIGRGSTLRLFVLIAGLGTLTTIGMSLDTTAVLLTPVALTLTAVAFAARMALPELAAVLITVGYLGLVHRRDLTGRYQSPEPVRPADAVLFWTCAAACAALGPAVLLGVPPWAAAGPCAVVCVLAFARRRRTDLALALLPWRLVILTEGLFLVVTTLARHGGTRLLARLAGHSALATTAVAGAASNAVNNLPAYLAVETTVPPGHTTQLLAALLGTNAGPLILLWGSLATLLWRDRCRARGLAIAPGRFALVGLGGVPLVLLGTWAALTLTG
jgi:arsenical pump membrane protein